MGLISNGTTIFDNGSMASGFGGSLNFISKATASASASIEFTSGIDSTYKEYVFYFLNMHYAEPSISVELEFQCSTNSGSTYGVTATGTTFRSQHDEADTDTGLAYLDASGHSLAQSTGFIKLGQNTGDDNDKSLSGYLHLYNPSSTTFVKQFISRTQSTHYGDYSYDLHKAGYFNTTSSIDAIKFRMSVGNIESGEILLFGVN